MNKLIVTSVLTLMLVVSAAAMSSPRGPGVHDNGLRMLGFIADEIGLTIEQENAINELINQSQLESAVDRERMSQIREEMRKLSQADGTFESSTASVLADELSVIVARGAVSAAELHWQIRQVLTEEQRQHIADLRSNRGEHRYRFEPEALTM